jgi:hypothetical protein
VRKFLVRLREYLIKNKPQFGEIIRSTGTFMKEAKALLEEALKEHTEFFVLQEQK